MARKRKKRIILWLLPLFILLHDNDLIPILTFSAFKSQFAHGYKYCDIPSGALASHQGVKYIFEFENGDKVERGNGERVISIIQKKSIDLGWSGGFPLLKSFRVKLQFECFDKKQGDFLGNIEFNGRFTSYGLISKEQSRQSILALFYQEFDQLMTVKASFIDESELYTDNGFDGWQPKMSKDLTGIKDRQLFNINRQITLKSNRNQWRDSIPYSTIGGDSSQISHEIIECSRTLGYVKFYRFLNSGKIELHLSGSGEKIKEELYAPPKLTSCYPCGDVWLDIITNLTAKP